MRALKAKLLSHAHAQLKEEATRTSNQQKHCAAHTNQTTSTQISHCVYVQSTSSLGWTPELIFRLHFQRPCLFLVALSFGCFAHLCNCEGLGFPCMARPYHRHRSKPWELGDVLSTNRGPGWCLKHHPQIGGYWRYDISTIMWR